jgi:uridine kinase
MKSTLQPIIVAITGGSGAGKTWLAGRLQGALGYQAVRLSQDDFYKDLRHLSPARRAKTNFDHPHAIDWHGFEAVLQDCRANRATQVPRYDFASHTRCSDARPFIPSAVVLVEGLWLLWEPPVRHLFDLKIFINCPVQLRLERRLARDVAERGRTPESVHEQFSASVAPMHERFVAPQAAWADIILEQPLNEKDPLERINNCQVERPGPRTPETMALARQECCPSII